jgi:hypothetical protein
MLSRVAISTWLRPRGSRSRMISSLGAPKGIDGIKEGYMANHSARRVFGQTSLRQRWGDLLGSPLYPST